MAERRATLVSSSLAGESGLGSQKPDGSKELPIVTVTHLDATLVCGTIDFDGVERVTGTFAARRF